MEGERLKSKSRIGTSRFKKSTFSAGLGAGYGGAYPDLSADEDGFVYVMDPLLDIRYKYFYNFRKRSEKGKPVDNNWGNFVSFHILVRGNSIAEKILEVLTLTSHRSDLGNSTQVR